MTNPERRERIRKVLNEHRHEADFTNTVIALEALMPEVMSEEAVDKIFNSIDYVLLSNEECPLCNFSTKMKDELKALTIAKPQDCEKYKDEIEKQAVEIESLEFKLKAKPVMTKEDLDKIKMTFELDSNASDSYKTGAFMALRLVASKLIGRG